MDTNFQQKTEQYRAAFEEALAHYMQGARFRPAVLDASVRYSLENGGKRIRPALMFAVTQMLGGKIADVEGFAVALEMIHTYSLIHDDLPAMDNDDFRRGRPSNHKQFGEGQAILAGDALLNEAYDICIRQCYNGKTYIDAAALLCGNAGGRGMVAGQAADLYYQLSGENAGRTEAEFIVLNKTAKMIVSAVTVPAVVYGADENIVGILSEFGKNLGFLFQITDDILDVTGDFAKLGKTLGKDAAEEKLSYVQLFGLDKSSEMADNYRDLCLRFLAQLPYDAAYLEEMVRAIRARQS